MILRRDTPETTSRRGVSRWAIAAAAIALCAAIAVRLSRSPDEIVDLRRLSPGALSAAVLLQVVSQLLWNGAMLLPLRSHMKELGYWELFMVRTGGFVAGHVVPIANLAVRMAYLKRRGLGYAEFTWATALSNVLALFSGSALAAVALVALWMRAGPPPLLVVGLTATVLAAGVGGIAVFEALPRLARHPWLRQWSWLSSMSGFDAGRGTVGWSLALLLLRHLFNFVTFGLLFASLSRLDFLAGGLVYAITSPVRILTITPGNLGVNEWAVAVVSKTLSTNVATGLMVALVFRGVSVLAQGVALLFAAPSMATTGRRS